MRAMIHAAIAACLLLIACPADAADPGPWSPPAPFPSMEDIKAPPAVHNRSAFYVGAVAGLDVAQIEAATFKFSDAAWLAGGFVGFNVRFPASPFLIGVEGDYVFTDVKASPGMLVVATTHYLASVRARAGVGVGPALLYVTAGPAFTENKLVIPGATDKTFQIGAALGAGVEAELTKALFVRLEAIHYMFPDNDSTNCGPSCLYTSKDQQTTVRAAVGFKLN
jgi:opacity protein-like surface antigen